MLRTACSRRRSGRSILGLLGRTAQQRGTRRRTQESSLRTGGNRNTHRGRRRTGGDRNAHGGRRRVRGDRGAHGGRRRARGDRSAHWGRRRTRRDRDAHGGRRRARRDRDAHWGRRRAGGDRDAHGGRRCAGRNRGTHTDALRAGRDRGRSDRSIWPILTCQAVGGIAVFQGLGLLIARGNNCRALRPVLRRTDREYHGQNNRQGHQSKSSVEEKRSCCHTPSPRFDYRIKWVYQSYSMPTVLFGIILPSVVRVNTYQQSPAKPVGTWNVATRPSV